MTPKLGPVKGISVSLSLNCCSEEEIKNFYAKLSADENADHPIEDTFRGAMLATVLINLEITGYLISLKMLRFKKYT